MMMLVSDSLMGSMAMYLTYITFKLLLLLKSKSGVYNFGSHAWWHWIEHISITTLCFVGLLGLTTTKVVHTILDRSSASVLFVMNEFNEWALINGFTTVLMLAVILLVNHI